MMNWPQLFRQIMLGNGPLDWLLATLVFLLTFAVVPLVRSYLRAQRERYASRELPDAVALLAHLIDRTSRWVLWLVALYLAERILTLPAKLDHVFNVAIILGCWLQIGIWVTAATRFGLQRQQERHGDPKLAGTIGIVMFVARLIIWIIVALLALSNLGINVSTLVAGLGIGGIAIALAVQTVLGDLLASISIALDKPFAVGDLLRVDTYEGTVEQIGIKSTRMRSVTGEQIIVSNTDLLKSRVRNLGRMADRRALFNLSIAYDTPVPLLDRVPQLVQEAVAAIEQSRYAHCLVKELGDSAIIFEVCFFVEHHTGRELGLALDAVNRKILHSFADTGILFAHPTRTVYLRNRQA